MSDQGTNLPGQPRFSSQSCRVGAIRGLGILVLLGATRLLAVDPIQVYPTLTLKDGREFSAVEIINYTTGGVLVRHAGGATVFRMDVLPDDVVAALHLKNWATVEPTAANKAEAAEASIADRPAISESDVVAMTAQRAQRPSGSAIPETANLPTPVAAQPETATAEPAGSLATPSGEGNMPEFFGVQKQEIGAPKSAFVNLGGRVVVTPPSGGIVLLGDVEVRGYPANLLAGYLQQAKANCEVAARKLLDRANVAANEGRFTDYNSLTAQARDVAAHYLDNLPEAPFVTRSDEYGNFTLRHNLSDLRLVATGRVTSALEAWNYEWIGVAPEKEANLTEANATAISTTEMNQSKYAAR